MMLQVGFTYRNPCGPCVSLHLITIFESLVMEYRIRTVAVQALLVIPLAVAQCYYHSNSSIVVASVADMT